MGENGACAAGKSAQDLLTEFQQTGQEAPFAEIARRYAGMVYNVALRVTHDAHDAEDATQATFLTLAVHAKTSGKIRFLGPWLKKVSHRLALDIRRSKKRRTAREQRHAASNGAESNGNGHDLPVSASLHTEELRNILREEIDRLPAKYRMPLIFYYFGGLTPEEIGEQLHCNTSTLGVRLHRGRKMLADSLGSRGISMTAAIVAAVLAGLVDSFVRDNVVHATTSAAMQASANGLVPASAASGHVLHLMRIATSALKYVRLKAVVGVAVLMVSTFALGREAMKHFDIDGSTLLQQLNPMRLIQPLLDRIISRPHFSMQVNPSAPPLHGIDHLPSDGELPLGLNLADLDFVGATSFAPRAGAISSSSTSNIQRSTSPIIQLSSVTPSQPTFVNSSNHVSAPAYQLPAAVLSHSQAASASPQNSAAAASVVGTSSIGAVPAFAMPAPNQALIIDRKTGDIELAGAAVANFTLPNGTTRVPTVVIGDVMNGRLTQNMGTLHATERVVVANQPASKGTYQVGGSAIVESPMITVGNAGNGTLNQTGGTINAMTSGYTGQFVLGAQPSGSGTFNLTGGSFNADTVVVGQQGQGQVNQNGGTASVVAVTIGADPGASGTWTSLSPILTTFHTADPATIASMMDNSQSPAAPPVPTIIVGQNGSGTLSVEPSSSDGSAPIQEQPDAPGTSLVIRSGLTGAGTFTGAGMIDVTGTLTMNGQIIANGNGSHQALDLSSASKVSNTIENTPNGGANGWYARNLGSLILPRIPISGTKNYTWGEDTLDDTIDLVNSVRFQPHSSDPDGPNGDAGITLYDPNDPAIPGLPGGHRAVGMWSFDTTADISSVDLVVRFDDQMANALDIPLADLGLWAYQDKWVQVDDSSFAIDLAQDLISGTVSGSFSYFAVGGLPASLQPQILDASTPPAPPTSISLTAAQTPEPGTALLTVAALGTLISLRRSRRRRD